MKKVKMLISAIMGCAFFLYCNPAQNQNIISKAEFSYENIKDLVVEGSFCYVEVKTGVGNKLSFNGEITGNMEKDKYEIKYRQEGSYVKVWVEQPKTSWNNISGKLIFTAPKNINLTVENSSGRIYTEGLEGEKFNLRTSSGNITSEKIRSKAILKTSSGDIKINNLTGNLEARTSSGGQYLSNIEGNIQTVASSGKIQCNTITGNIDAGNSSGGIRVTNTSGILSLKATSGGITGESVNLTGNSDFKTSSGKIKIQLKNDLDELSFNLSSSSGELLVGGSKKGKNYFYNAGKILIRGISSSGNQQYY